MVYRLLRQTIALLCAAVMILSAGIPEGLCAEEIQKTAEDISGKHLLTQSTDPGQMWAMFDKVVIEGPLLKDDTKITLSHEKGIGSLYLIFSLEYGPYTVINEDNGDVHTWGEGGFLHEFLDLEAAFGEAPTSVTLCFENGRARLNEIYAFTSGQVPDFVQIWELPKEGETDLLLFSTHGDDEQLFFAGLLPYYAQEMDYQVQVVYLTDHRNMTLRRTGEMLNGLWAVGVRTYPVFGSFADLQSTSKKEAYLKYQRRGITQEELLEFVVEQLRRFRPKVAVGHDVQGEYGHGMHMLYTDLLFQALEISDDPAQYPELAEKYGLWDVPKTYIHLYPENRVFMDWDVPLESFDGMTAYEVTKKLGFPCHKTQQEYFAWFFSGISRADQIPMYSPCEYGLYRSTVGQDVQKKDFFENLTTHAQDAELERLRLEEEARLAAEAETTPPETTQTQPPATMPVQTEPPATETPVQYQKQDSILLPIAVFTGLAGLVLGAGFGVIFRRKNRNKNF